MVRYFYHTMFHHRFFSSRSLAVFFFIAAGGIIFTGIFLLIPHFKSSSFPASSVHAQTTSFFDCAKAPYNASPACKGEHPRLHITKDTLPQIKQKIQTYYMKEYQEYVSWADSVFDKGGAPDDIYHQFNAELTAFAFIGLMGDIPGITYQHTPAQFTQKSIQVLLDKAGA